MLVCTKSDYNSGLESQNNKLQKQRGIKNENLPCIVVIEHINKLPYGAVALSAVIKLEYHSVCVISLTGTVGLNGEIP